MVLSSFDGKEPLKNLGSKKIFKRLKIFILIKKCFSDAEKLFWQDKNS